MAEIGTLETQVKIEVRMTLLSAIKWRLLGFHKREITSKTIGEITEVEIKVVQTPKYLKLKRERKGFWAWLFTASEGDYEPHGDAFGELPEYASGEMVMERECPETPPPESRIQGKHADITVMDDLVDSQKEI